MAEKRKLSGKAVVADIRAGLSDPDLAHKYGISQKGLQSLFKKLLDAGLVTDEEMKSRMNDVELDLDMEPDPSKLTPSFQNPSSVSSSAVRASTAPSPFGNTEEARPWYDRTLLVTILLFVLPPLALYAVYKNTRLSRKLKLLLISLGMALCVAVIREDLIAVSVGWVFNAVIVGLCFVWQGIQATRPVKVLIVGGLGLIFLSVCIAVAPAPSTSDSVLNDVLREFDQSRKDMNQAIKEIRQIFSQ